MDLAAGDRVDQREQVRGQGRQRVVAFHSGTGGLVLTSLVERYTPESGSGERPEEGEEVLLAAGPAGDEHDGRPTGTGFEHGEIGPLGVDASGSHAVRKVE